MSNSDAPLRVGLLGPLLTHRGPVPIDLGPTKQRAVFAVLALHVGAVVPIEAVLDLVWGDRQPASARQLVHTYIARLRHLLEPQMPPRERVRIIGSASGGYRLSLAPDSVDATRFGLLCRHARRYLTADEPARAFGILGEAMRLWRDPGLTDLTALLHEADVVEALRRSWSAAALDFVGTGLELGEASAVLPIAYQLATAEPMHELAQARYLSALEQTGQRAAAIEHFNDVRVLLSDELGVPPGRQLADVYRSVLLGLPHPHSAATGGQTPTAPSRAPWRGPGPAAGQLIGREPDLDAVVRTLAEHRLLTITGPPGCGKSALALQAAAHLHDGAPGGVAVLECSGMADGPALIDGLVRLLDGTPRCDTPARLLGDQEALLVLDNVEHLIDACALMVDEIVRACWNVSVVATSREPLGLPYETLWRLHTLAPDETARAVPVTERPAVRLFAGRALQVCPAFRLDTHGAEAVAALCERLDDLPLAIELAAACLATDTLDELVVQLDDPLRQLRRPRRGSPAHHRSLWSTLRRSMDCLNQSERWCFLRLGELPRSIRAADAQQAWCGSPWGPVDVHAMLTRLADKSLVCVRHDSDGTCYGMLRLVHGFAATMDAVEFA
ncbi:AfsR/SARP family transcriptional regulator [Mangrovihabitans endophyticus]|uniref:OmpR/PhoB-type domain-containing protein n=1 Tax=Mangrovihabitans endophyticus TaxID=1751298 RepID=A0A8J3BUV2_9ACTN|nr:BTAD domain-containing putative transcriptional regulator [Mangrovihabitans endophyticus]GGK76501.1 hypothetical protein GCM10012284_08070 [Mangrovihabitans endophyticus]